VRSETVLAPRSRHSLPRARAGPAHRRPRRAAGSAPAAWPAPPQAAARVGRRRRGPQRPPTRPPQPATRPPLAPRRSRRTAVITASSGKIDIKKVGLNSIDNETVRNNLQGRSRFMKDKNWVDPQGRKGKVRGAARAVRPAAAPHAPRADGRRLPGVAGAAGGVARARARNPGGACLPLSHRPYPAPPRAARRRPRQGYGVYRFEDKYGANVDGYSPIYTPDQWSASGETFNLGTKGLVAWCARAPRPPPSRRRRGASAGALGGQCTSGRGPGGWAAELCAAPALGLAPPPRLPPPPVLPPSRAPPRRLPPAHRAGLVVVLLAIGVSLIVSTSSLGQ